MAKQYGQPRAPNRPIAAKKSAPAKADPAAKRPIVPKKSAPAKADPAAKILSMADDERRVFVLKRIAGNGGKLEPIWQGSEDKGSAYFTTKNPNLNQSLHEDLGYLSGRDYLEK